MIKRILRKLARTSERTVQHAPSDTPLFDQPRYSEITEARIRHLKWMSLPVAGKTVIDMGCGIGRFSSFFSEQGCEVFCVDGRDENINKLKELYPSSHAAVIDLDTDTFSELASFDIVFCYGLLYHLSDPFSFIKKAGKICAEMIIVETCITDASTPLVQLVSENRQDVTQALRAIGCRPSPSYVATCLRLSGFKHIYTPTELPDHDQFRYKLKNDFSYKKGGHLIRGIFIGSYKEMRSNRLREWKLNE